MFVIGVAVVERRRRLRLCIERYLFTRDNVRRWGILNDVGSGLDSSDPGLTVI